MRLGAIECGDQRPEVQKSLERGEQSLLAELPKVRRDDPMLLYNVWTHAYGIQALVDMHGRLPDDGPRKEKIERLIRDQFTALGKYESAEGGWGYYDFDAGTQRPASSSTSFVNASVLVAFHDAKSMGIDPPQKLVDRGLLMTQKQRNPDNTYIYGTYLRNSPVMPINRAGGSLGRSQACNLALRLWGDTTIDDKVCCDWLDRLITGQRLAGHRSEATDTPRIALPSRRLLLLLRSLLCHARRQAAGERSATVLPGSSGQHSA